MKNKILFTSVNYNSYNELIDFLDSIELAVAKLISNNFEIDVIIGDNTTQNIKIIDLERYSLFNVRILNFKQNLGYMGAISKILNQIGFGDVKKYEYIVFSNVDLIIDENFFFNLFKTKFNSNIGWIAPQIYSYHEKKDRNPKMLNRPSKKRLISLMILFKFSILYNFYNNFIYKYRNKASTNKNNKVIYAGHGSLMIFTNEFIVNNYPIHYPSFLFGEELFFGELVRMSNLKVYYEPRLIVKDIDHVSTSKLKSKDYCKMNFDSIKKLIKLFWDE